MAKRVHVEDGFTLNDLLQESGTIIDLGEDYNNFDFEDDNFSYSPDIHLNNEEVINLINMEDVEIENKEEARNKDDFPSLICGISFDKLKPSMTDITGDGKVLKLVKQEGVGEAVPPGAQITVKYVGYFEFRDEPFDSSFLRGHTETYMLGDGSLLPGLEIAISSMRKHETAIFIVHPDLAFGNFGCPPRIPPNEEAMFCVNLVNFLDKGFLNEFEKLTVEEKKYFKNIIKRVECMLNTAKDSFKRGRVKQAIREYERAVTWLEPARVNNTEEEREANRLISRAYCNLAVCYNKVGNPRRACIACVRTPIKSAKSCFNHGRALIKMGEYSAALKELQTSLRIEPNNTETFKEIQLANCKQRTYLEMEKRLWGNCLKVGQTEKDRTSFEKAARLMCEAFIRDNNILRQPLPEGLTPDEYKYISEQAAALGIAVTTHNRYGNEMTYLHKLGY